jgi:prepilin-type processing-associated H-X9-DG protein
LYANDNKGAYPMAAYQSGPVVIPTWGTAKPEPNDVSAAMFLLMNAEELTSEIFVCPDSSAEKWDFGGGVNTSHNWNNWPGREGVIRYLSYSMQNPYADDTALKRGFKWTSGLGADYVVMADINPGKSTNTDVLAVTPESTSAVMRKGNSPNHNYSGQNILFGDGHVDWGKDPFQGRGGDNIYARRAAATGWASSEVKNSPYDADDNVLLPTSE